MWPKWRFNGISYRPLTRGIITRGIVGASSVALALAGLYGVSRPCVIGSCVLIERQQQANDVTDQVAELLTSTVTSEDVIQAYDLLQEQIVDLSRIPIWSAHHAAAQRHLQGYVHQADTIAKLVSAQRSGGDAAIASQNAPHPIDTWQDIERQWQDAIADLNQVSDDSPGFQVAQRKLKEYQSNRDAIAQRIALEQDAQSKISEAREAAALAEARASRASEPEAWQQVYITWQVALDRLDAVNPYTMAYAEAQQLDALYRPHAAVAKEQQQQEQQSATAYQEANRLSQEAQTYEQQSQWSLATARWQTALDRLQRVPMGTAYYDQAQPLIHAYAKSLERSRQGLQIATAVQTSRSVLDRACQQTQLCDYVAASNAVHIHVVDIYRQPVDQAIRLAQTPATPALEQADGTVVQQLLQSMASLGSTIQIPIEFYDGAGALIGTYQPDTARYVVSEFDPRDVSPTEQVAIQAR